jgi:hypothetical protein
MISRTTDFEDAGVFYNEEPGGFYVEDLLPCLSYRALVESLVPLTQSGILSEGSLPTMLVVARLVDRRRIQSSGMSAADLRRAWESYGYRFRNARVLAVEEALERAIEIAYGQEQHAGKFGRENRGHLNDSAQGALENKAEAAA